MENGRETRFGHTAKKISAGALFALVLLIPELLRLSRNRRAQFAFRVFLGLAGTALVLWPLALRYNWLWAVLGVAMFVTAALLPPPRRTVSLDEKAHELGALVVVNGGEFQREGGEAAAVQLFVGSEKISAEDSDLREALTIPVAEIRELRTICSGEGACLRVVWGENAAEFAYRGFFAEHFARVAESTLRSVWRSPLPVLQEKTQSRAAGA